MTDTEHENLWERGLRPSDLFRRYGDCVVRVQVKTKAGDLANGTAFHIGGGVYVTARHVVDGMTDILLCEDYQAFVGDEGTRVDHVIFHADSGIDLALLISERNRVVFGDHGEKDPPKDEPQTFVPIPELYGEWINSAFTLSSGMICGFPVVPFSTHPRKIAVSAEINTEFDRYDKAHVHFIVSSVARGGFSGAPFISEFDMLLGVVTESISSGLAETPYMAVISVEPLYDLLNDNETILAGRLDHYLTDWSKSPRKRETMTDLVFKSENMDDWLSDEE